MSNQNRPTTAEYSQQMLICMYYLTHHHGRDGVELVVTDLSRGVGLVRARLVYTCHVFYIGSVHWYSVRIST